MLEAESTTLSCQKLSQTLERNFKLILIRCVGMN